MSRLTRKTDNEKLLEADIRYLTRNQYGIHTVLNKLGELEDLEEQGRLIELPYAIGDAVWTLSRGKIDEWEIESFEIDESGLYAHLRDGRVTDKELCSKLHQSKEEAEAKLKELKGE